MEKDVHPSTREVTLKEFVAKDGHIAIVRRADGVYSFRLIAHGDVRTEGMAGPYCGLYDSADTAETEARSRYPWINQHSTEPTGLENQMSAS